ncbi:MAG: hypothetical protein HY365_00840 [Candidatus Aenigmarchaeota archaeon]|nr:hypothetical protein [Candidatus Aenigmarchaeota archaeon]
MLFGKKESMQSIKDAVSDDAMPEHARDFYLPESRPAPPQPGTAPLFVKVDKYYDILRSVQEMKTFLAGTRHLYNVLAEIENVRNDALKIMHATLQKIEKNVVEIDSEFLRPGEAAYPTEQKTAEVQHVESSLNELQEQLSSLKKELQALR